jgi:hypothetical protein
LLVHEVRAQAQRRFTQKPARHSRRGSAWLVLDELRDALVDVVLWRDWLGAAQLFLVVRLLERDVSNLAGVVADWQVRRIFQDTSISMRTPMVAVWKNERTGSAVVGPVPDTISSAVVSSMCTVACSDTSNSGMSPSAVVITR